MSTEPEFIKTYLGDGVWFRTTMGGIIIFTEAGLASIYLDPEAGAALYHELRKIYEPTPREV